MAPKARFESSATLTVRRLSLKSDSPAEDGRTLQASPEQKVDVVFAVGPAHDPPAAFARAPSRRRRSSD
jgi:hypothetical protein